MAQEERKIKVYKDAHCFMGHSITPAGSGDGDMGGTRHTLSSVIVCLCHHHVHPALECSSLGILGGKWF